MRILVTIAPILLPTVRGFAPCMNCIRSGSVLKVTSGGDEDCHRQEIEDDTKMSEEDRRRFDQITQDFLSSDSDGVEEMFPDFPSAMPKNPFASGLDKARGEACLYSDDELMSVLDLHNELSGSGKDDEDSRSSVSLPKPGDESPLGRIHDMITKNLGMVEEPAAQGAIGSIDFSSQFTDIEIDDELKNKMKRIRAIASDVDGTILTKKQTIHPRTRLAIRKAIKLASSSSTNGDLSGFDVFFPATGKSRKGALESLGVEIGNLIDQKCPGVYLQGLFCVDSQGEVVFEKKLELDAIAVTEDLVNEFGISIVAYDGDDLFTTEQTDIVVHLHEHYGEPLPVLLPTNENGNEEEAPRMLSSHEPSMHKLLLMDDDVEKLTNVIRPRLEELAKMHGACVTQALPTMLELLPEGCSKKLGVVKLCEALGIKPDLELLAIGDAENDAGMIEMAAVGVAVGNATPPAKDASDFVVDFTNDEGGAGFAMELFVLNRY